MAAGAPANEGVTIATDGAWFTLRTSSATDAWLCLFAADERETRFPMNRSEDGLFSLFVAGAGTGVRYGFRTDGPNAPDDGLFHDPAKLLADPYASRFDRPFVFSPRLAAPRAEEVDTAQLVPKCVVEKLAARKPGKTLFKAGGLVLEINVRAFSMLHPDVAPEDRGTVRALAYPSIIAHLKRIGVDAVELMPLTAWIDERHLPPLGLSNAWGYNPVTFMAVDPRLCPNGIADLRLAVAALRKAGIGVILDLVFNHTGESDRFGPVISMRGIDNRAWYRHAQGAPGHLINDTGCGNTVACDHPDVQANILASLRHFVLCAGVDGFRFDLAPIMARDANGFSRDAELLARINADPVLADRVLIAEPWDIGPGGYQLGNFPLSWLEWNDRARDDMRRFWRGDDWTLGSLATRLAGSADIFNHNHAAGTRSVNFLAAHDGFTLADLVSFAGKHNEANGEQNRDGHNDNHSWNNGVEGETSDPAVTGARRRDVKALLSTLFASKGTIMLTAGDEWGRTQHGNNNAYAQDNARFWLDWASRDEALINHVAELSKLRRKHAVLRDPAFLNEGDVAWLRVDGEAMHPGDWDQPQSSRVAMILHSGTGRLAVLINRTAEPARFNLPSGSWADALSGQAVPSAAEVPPRAVRFIESQA
jgi:glycogen debranching enzyme